MENSMNAVVGIAGLEKLSRHYLDLYRSLRIDTARLESDVRPDSADAAPRIRQLYRTLTDLSNNQALELADRPGRTLPRNWRLHFGRPICSEEFCCSRRLSGVRWRNPVATPETWNSC
jgi:hypothetical protein